MTIVFEKEYLEQLYSEGKAKSKKYRFQKGVITKYKQTIDKLRVANRIEFRSTIEGAGSDTITICSIVELSNHYK